MPIKLHLGKTSYTCCFPDISLKKGLGPLATELAHWQFLNCAGEEGLHVSFPSHSTDRTCASIPETSNKLDAMCIRTGVKNEGPC